MAQKDILNDKSYLSSTTSSAKKKKKEEEEKAAKRVKNSDIGANYSYKDVMDRSPTVVEALAKTDKYVTPSGTVKKKEKVTTVSQDFKKRLSSFTSNYQKYYDGIQKKDFSGTSYDRNADTVAETSAKYLTSAQDDARYLRSYIKANRNNFNSNDLKEIETAISNVMVGSVTGDYAYRQKNEWQKQFGSESGYNRARYEDEARKKADSYGTDYETANRDITDTARLYRQKQQEYLTAQKNDPSYQAYNAKNAEENRLKALAYEKVAEETYTKTKAGQKQALCDLVAGVFDSFVTDKITDPFQAVTGIMDTFFPGLRQSNAENSKFWRQWNAEYEINAASRESARSKISENAAKLNNPTVGNVANFLGQTATSVLSSFTDAAVLAGMGWNTAADLSSKISAIGNTGNGIKAGMEIISNTLKSVPAKAIENLSNPYFVLSWMQEFNRDYEQALKETGDTATAGQSALISSFIKGQIEVGFGEDASGIQGDLSQKKWYTTAAEEAKEEFVQGLSERTVQKLTYDYDKPVVSLKEGEDAILNPYTSVEEILGGALGAMMHSAGYKVSETVANNLQRSGIDNKTVQTVLNAALQEMDRSDPAFNKTRQLAIKAGAGKAVSTRQLNNAIYNGVNARVQKESKQQRISTAENKIDALDISSESKETAKNIAKKFVNGVKLTEEENKAVSVNEEVNAALSSDFSQNVSRAENEYQATTITEDTEYAERTSSDGVTRLAGTGEAVTVASVESVTDDGTEVKLKNGRTADIGDIEFASEGEAIFWNSMASMDDTATYKNGEKVSSVKVTAADANRMIKAVVNTVDSEKTLAENGGIIAAEMTSAYRIGRAGLPATALNRLTHLTEFQRNVAYSIGKARLGNSNQANLYSKANARQEAIDKGRATVKKSSIDKGTVVIEDGTFFAEEGSEKRARQDQAVKVMTRLAKALNLKVYLYSSTQADLANKTEKAKNGWYDPNDGSIHIDLNAGENSEGMVLFTASHELSHFIRDWSPTKFMAMTNFLVKEYGGGLHLAELATNQMEKARLNGQKMTYTQAVEEVFCDSFESMLVDERVLDKIEALRKQDATLVGKIAEFFRGVARKLKGYETIKSSAEYGLAYDLGKKFDRFADMFAEAAAEAGENFGKAGEYSSYVESTSDIKPGSPMTAGQEIATSLRRNSELMQKAIDFNEGTRFVGKDVMKTASKVRNRIRKYMIENADKLKLPEDIEGNTLFGNKSYGLSGENSTVCIRSLTMDRIVAMMEEELGRPLTINESIWATQNIGNYTDAPPCAYCYVAADRMAFNDGLSKAFDQKDIIFDCITKGMNIEDTIERAKNVKNPTKTELARIRYWYSMAQSGEIGISRSDVAGVEYSDGGVKKKRDKLTSTAQKEEYDKVISYARSASHAKKRVSYTAYNGNILGINPENINALNRDYGFRMYSYSDFSPAFILENMQMVTDAAARGLKMLAYTKELDFVRIFAPTGMNINISVYAYMQDGQIAEDAMQGAAWKEAQELRKKYPNVGITLVATNDAIVNEAKTWDWVDVVLPYHSVFSGGSHVAKYYGFQDYKAVQADQRTEKGQKAKDIKPPVHQNDLIRYADALIAAKESPRFPEQIQGFEDYRDGRISAEEFRRMNPYYMKFVNETRQSSGETQVVQPVFDEAAAIKSLQELEKRGGYDAPLGKDASVEMEIAQELAEKIRNGENKEKSFSARNNRYLDQTQYIKYPESVDIDPNTVQTVNDVTDSKKLDYLVDDFKRNGYNGRPIVAVGNEESSVALTGSHRIYAAREAGISIPTVLIDYSGDNNERLIELLETYSDEERESVASELLEEGIISQVVYDLIKRENDLNNDNWDVPYSEQARYQSRNANKIINDLTSDDIQSDTEAEAVIRFQTLTNEIGKLEAEQEKLDAARRNETDPDRQKELDEEGYRLSEKISDLYAERSKLAGNSVMREIVNRVLESNKTQRTKKAVSLEEENRRLKKKLTEAERQLKASDKRTLSEADVQKLAGSLIRETQAKGIMRDDIKGDLNAIADEILNGDGNENAEDMALSLADKLIAKASEMRDDSADTRHSLIQYLKSANISIPKENKGDIDPDVRKKNAWWIHASGTPVNEIWGDINERFPGLFGSEITNPADMISDIVGALEGLQPQSFNPYAGIESEARYEIARAIIGGIVSEDVRQNLPTLRDKLNTALQENKQYASYIRRQERRVASLEGKNATLSEGRKKVSEEYRRKLADLKKKNKEQTNAKVMEIREAERKKTEAVAERYKERISETQKARKRREIVGKIKRITDDLNKRLENPQKNKYVPKQFAKDLVTLLEHLDVPSIDEVRVNGLIKAKSENIKKIIERLERIQNDIYKATSIEGRNILQEQYDKVFAELQKADNTLTKYYDRKNSIGEKVLSLSAMYDRFAKSTNPDDRIVYDGIISDMLAQLYQDVEGTPVSLMSNEQLETVYKTMRAVHKVITEAIKLKNSKIEKDAYEASMQMLSETASIDKKQTSVLSKWNIAQLSALRAFELFGNYAKNSMWVQAYEMLNDGQLKATRIRMEMANMFDGLIRDKRFKTLRDLVDIGLKDENGNAIMIPKDFALAVYMDLQNEDNTRHVRGGGYEVIDVKEWLNGNVSEAYGAGIVMAKGFSEELSSISKEIRDAESRKKNASDKGEDVTDIDNEIDALKESREDVIRNAGIYTDDILKKVTDIVDGDPYLKSWVDTAIELLDDKSKKYLNETTMDYYGFEKANVPHYFPIRSSRFFIDKSFDTMVSNISLENSGFMKDRVESANPIMLSGLTDTLARQIDRVSNYSGLMIPMKNFEKMYGKMKAGYETSLKKTLNDKFGKTADEYISNLMADLTGSRSVGHDIISKVFLGLRSPMAQGVLSANLRVALSQTASFPTAAAEIGWKPIAKALAKGGKNNRLLSRADKELIAKYSPLLWDRMQGYDSMSVKDLPSYNDKKMLQSARGIMGWIQAMDGATVGRLWYAAQYYIDDTASLEKGTDAYYQAVAKVFNRIVENTQPDYQTLQRPDILRSNNGITKMLTMFMTQRMQNYNIIESAFMNAVKTKQQFVRSQNGVTKADVKVANRRLWDSISSQLVAGAILVIFKAIADAILHRSKSYRDDDTGELDAESVMKQLAYAFADSEISNLLLGSEMYSLINALVTRTDYEGVSINGVDGITDIVNNVIKIEKAISDISEINTEIKTAQGGIQELRNSKDEKLRTIGNNVYYSVKSLSSLTGIPFGNISGIVEGLLYHVQDIRNGEALSLEAGYDYTDEQKKNNLSGAYATGDQDEIAKWESELGDNKAASYRREYLKSDPRIDEANTAWYTSDYDTYESLVNEIVSEGVFSEEEVTKAVKGSGGTWNAKSVAMSMQTGEKTADIIQSIRDDATDGLKGKDAREADKNACQKIRSAITSYWKPIYLESSGKERVAIRKKMLATGLYESYSDIEKQTNKWVNE